MTHANMAAWFQQHCDGVVITNGTHRLGIFFDRHRHGYVVCAVFWHGMFAHDDTDTSFVVSFESIEQAAATQEVQLGIHNDF